MGGLRLRSLSRLRVISHLVRSLSSLWVSASLLRTLTCRASIHSSRPFGDLTGVASIGESLIRRISVEASISGSL
jgi:hypothetical protein